MKVENVTHFDKKAFRIWHSAQLLLFCVDEGKIRPFSASQFIPFWKFVINRGRETLFSHFIIRIWQILDTLFPAAVAGRKCIISPDEDDAPTCRASFPVSSSILLPRSFVTLRLLSKLLLFKRGERGGGGCDRSNRLWVACMPAGFIHLRGIGATVIF